MRRIERRPQARFDLLAIYNYIADNGGEVRAEPYLRRLDGAIHDLARHPLMAVNTRPGAKGVGGGLD